MIFKYDKIHIYFTKTEEVHVLEGATGTSNDSQVLVFVLCALSPLHWLAQHLHWFGNYVTRKL